MPTKSAYSADGVKTKQRSKKDSRTRTFELYGSYSSKHLRVRDAAQTKEGCDERADKKKRK